MFTKEFTQHFIGISWDIFPVFIIAIFFAAIIEEFLPSTFIDRHLKKSNFPTMFNASIIGALIPMCTCGMIPLAFKLYKKGLNWKVLIAFLSAGNASSIHALLLTSVMGLDVVFIRFSAAVAFGLLVAYFWALIVAKDFKFEIIYKAAKGNCCGAEPGNGPYQERLKRVMVDFFEMLRNFIPWLLLAILVASLFNSNFNMISSSEFLTMISTKSPVNPLIFSIVGFPFYFCSGADIPLSKTLLEAGVALGSVLSFMTAAPGVNFTSLMVYKQCMGMPKAITLTLISILISSIIGIVINLL